MCVPARVSFNRYQMARLTAPRRDAFYVRRPCTAISRRGQCEDNRTPPPCYLVFPVIPLFLPLSRRRLFFFYTVPFLPFLTISFPYTARLFFFFVTHFFSSPPPTFIGALLQRACFITRTSFPCTGNLSVRSSS